MNQRTTDPDDEEPIAATGNGETKKPYLSPQLVCLGTLADMTLTVGSSGRSDGGRFRGRTRTAF